MQEETKNKKINRFLLQPSKVHAILFVASVFFLSPVALVFADTMTSANYKVQADDMSIGGGYSTSANYTADGEVGGLATGDSASASFKACAGLECFKNVQYLSFAVAEGVTAPAAVSGAGVSLGTLTTGAVATSDGAAINSVFLSVTSSAAGGVSLNVNSRNAGLKRGATADTIASATATLSAGTAGFGVCTFSVAQDGASPTALAKVAPYNGSCTKTVGHAVGVVDTTNRILASSTGVLQDGTAEVLVKAAISATTPAGNDYSDVLTFIAAGTF